ncbi:MAG TPA: VOC family protein [Micromonosporaceae bacterium]|nr:VOC family protein [Micromonosporaceae bacterium]
MADDPVLDVVFDCADPDRVARFWMAALPGYDFPHGPPDGYQTWDEWADANNIPEDQRNLARTLVDKAGNRPTIFFNQVPEPTAPGKNRLHLDIKVAGGLPADQRRARIEAEAARLVAAGGSIAQRIDEPASFWIIMRDVEGNEFCVS